MKHKSCATNLLESMEKIMLESDNNIPMDVIYLDFSKAFDIVPKHRLIHKLKSHSIEGNVLSWINNLLTGRRQRVIINGEQSTWEAVLCTLACDILQDCLNLLCEWADLWGRSFNVAKCKILHVGHNNPKYEYFMNGIKLSEVKI